MVERVIGNLAAAGVPGPTLEELTACDMSDPQQPEALFPGHDLAGLLDGLQPFMPDDVRRWLAHHSPSAAATWAT